MDKRNIINIVILVLIVAVLGIGYQFFFAGNSSSSASLQTTGALSSKSNSIADTADFLAIVAGLRSLKLDTSLFSNPAFKDLQDFGVTLSPQPVRNSNPFLPLHATVAASSTRVR